MTSNPEPTPIQTARFRYLLSHLLARRCFTDSELREYHRLSSIWTELFNARKKGIALSAAQVKFMDVKRESMFKREALSKGKRRWKFFGFRAVPGHLQ